MPTIVIYRPNIFIDDQYEKEKFLLLQNTPNNNTYTQFIDYTKSKQCTELLLAYLVYFFKQHTECKGSGIVPRFNAQVTDMIFFAQGNGDNKVDNVNQDIQNLFTKDKVYLKSTGDENFEINIQQVLEQAENFKNAPAVNLSPANEMTNKAKSKDVQQRPSDLQKKQENLTSNRPINIPNINQSSSSEAPKPLPAEEPSLGIFARIGNWFKSLFITLFQILNF